MLSAALTLALTACGGEGGTEQFQLDGTSWMLVAYDQSKPIEGTTPTLLFHTGQVYSSVDCNTIGGGYSTEGDRIYFGALYMTENTCQEPEGIMEMENIYMQMLSNAYRFSIEDDRLIIFVSYGGTLTYDRIN